MGRFITKERLPKNIIRRKAFKKNNEREGAVKENIKTLMSQRGLEDENCIGRNGHVKCKQI